MKDYYWQDLFWKKKDAAKAIWMPCEFRFICIISAKKTNKKIHQRITQTVIKLLPSITNRILALLCSLAATTTQNTSSTSSLCSSSCFPSVFFLRQNPDDKSNLPPSIWDVRPSQRVNLTN